MILFERTSLSNTSLENNLCKQKNSKKAFGKIQALFVCRDIAVILVLWCIQEKNNEKESDLTVLFEYCATGSYKDKDGDTVSVTCCRPTQADADRCATNKIIEKAIQEEAANP